MVSHIEGSACAKPLEEIHVLVAEDIPLARTILSRHLPKAFRGSTISFVDCGEEAKKALLGQEYLATSPDGSKKWIEKGSHFDVAFLDHAMPEERDGAIKERTGIGVAENVRDAQTDCKRCFLVSHSSAQLGEAEREVSDLFDEVLIKPASPSSYKRIAREVRHRRMG